MRTLHFAIVALFIIRMSAIADDAHVTRVFVEQEISKVVEVLNDDDLAPDLKMSKVREIAYAMFDLDAMVKIVVGRHRRRFSKEQLREFTDLFAKQIESSFFNKVESFGEVTFEYDTATKTNAHYYVPSHVDFRGERYSILYKLRQNKDGWRVWDVVVEKISTVYLNKSQYQELLHRMSIEELLVMMRKKNAALSAESAAADLRLQRPLGSNTPATLNKDHQKE